MPDREALIRSIAPGDIFHVSPSYGGSLICVATAVNDTTISARRLLVPEDFEFDRTIGVQRSTRHHCPIVSIAPLPPDIRHVLENLDYRHNYGPKPVDTKLTKAEKHALLFIADHCRANPI
jgi:hypothetical protein